MRILYGGKAATADVRDVDGSTVLSVSLDVDPGFGSMHFHRLSPCANIVFVDGSPAEFALCAREFAKDARYMTPGPGRDRHLLRASDLAERGQKSAEAAFHESVPA